MISPRFRQLAAQLVCLLAVAALCAGCEGKSDSGAESGGEEQASEEGGGASETPAEEAEGTKPDGHAALRTALVDAGFELAEDVPFDDEGTLPEGISSGTADGIADTAAWVLRKGEGDDAAWVQVFVATFETPKQAEARADSTPTPIVRDRHAIYVLSLGDKAAVQSAKNALGAP